MLEYATMQDSEGDLDLGPRKGTTTYRSVIPEDGLTTPQRVLRIGLQIPSSSPEET